MVIHLINNNLWPDRAGLKGYALQKQFYLSSYLISFMILLARRNNFQRRIYFIRIAFSQRFLLEAFHLIHKYI
jgi:hypothetical protein